MLAIIFLVDGHFCLAAMILFTVKVVGLKLFDVHGNLNVKSTGKINVDYLVHLVNPDRVCHLWIELYK